MRAAPSTSASAVVISTLLWLVAGLLGARARGVGAVGSSGVLRPLAVQFQFTSSSSSCLLLLRLRRRRPALIFCLDLLRFWAAWWVASVVTR
eukprot:scaffold97370_cov35-Tisochrysis_lutea.AAC.3